MATKSLSRSKSISLRRPKRSDQKPAVPEPDPDVTPRRDAPNPDCSPRHHPHRADSATASGNESEGSRPYTASARSYHKTPADHKTSPDNHLCIVLDADQDPAHVKNSAEINMSIGMALGSPPHIAPAAWKRFNPPTPSQPDFIADQTMQSAARPMTSDGGRKKSNIWKSLFGGRQAPRTPQPFYRLQAAPLQKTPKPPSPPSLEKNRGSADPPVTTHKMAEGRKLSKAYRSGKHSRSRSRIKNDVDSKTLDVLNSTAPAPTAEEDGLTPVQRAATSPLLNVDIPNVEMERYSIMFGNVLKRDRSSNLLQRRQGNKDVLKPLDSESLRRANQDICQQDKLERPGDTLRPVEHKPWNASPSSPSLAPPSPVFSLFPRQSMQESRTDSPATTPRTMASPFRKPMQRAVTDPPTTIKFSTSPNLARDGNRRKGSEAVVEQAKLKQTSTAPAKMNPVAQVATRPALKKYIPGLSPNTSARSSLDSAQSFETAIGAQQGHQSDAGHDGRHPLNSHVAGAGWDIPDPALKIRTAARSGSESTSMSDSTLSSQSQSPLSSLSGQSIAIAQDKAVKENEARALERERIIRRTEKEHAQPKTKAKRAYSDASTHIGTIDMTNGKEKRHADTDTAYGNAVKRQPTLKERAEEVQNATRVAIARQVSISRQRAQSETIRASHAERASARAAERERARANEGAEQPEPGSGIGAQSRVTGDTPAASTCAADDMAVRNGGNRTALHRSPIIRRSKTTSTVRPRLETAVRPGTASSHTGTAIATTPTATPSLQRGASLLVVQRSPTGERLVERRNLTPVLVDIPNRKSAYGLVDA